MLRLVPTRFLLLVPVLLARRPVLPALLQVLLAWLLLP